MTDQPLPFDSPFYERCNDPNCETAYAYRDPFQPAEHWHFRGSPDHPAWDVP